MYLASKALYLYTNSPIHAGAGASLSAVDLPIQRERISGFPIIHAGGLKGALRDAARSVYTNNELLEAIFGPEEPNFAASIGVGDARILLFPVRSIKGVFAWTTCGLALERWARTLKDLHESFPEIPTTSLGVEPDGTPHCFALNGVRDTENYVVLEDVVFKDQSHPTKDNNDLVAKLASWLADMVFPNEPGWGERLKNNLVILPNDEFAFFVQHSTEVLTRIRLIPDTKTVQPGALWTEEHLPEDTLLYAPVHARRIMSPSNNHEVRAFSLPDKPLEEAVKVLDDVQQKLSGILQIGGDETTGCGFARMIWK